jgi:hypothetical protein
MGNRKQNEPAVYQKLVRHVRAGFLALDENVQKEIKCFLATQQVANGAFADRAGNADVYYSLFGMWLTMATEQHKQIAGLKNFIASQKDMQFQSIVEELAFTLMEIELYPAKRQLSAFSLVRKIRRKGKSINFAYQFFLLALAIEATGKQNMIFNLFTKAGLLFFRNRKNMSCSIVAALLYAKNMFGLKTQKLKLELNEFSLETGGFRAFKAVETADSLSSGVALFVLKEIGADLRLLAPGCLNFFQNNYIEGAFLSGDGDLTKDVEYTFYSLLGLGSLVN